MSYVYVFETGTDKMNPPAGFAIGSPGPSVMFAQATR